MKTAICAALALVLSNAAMAHIALTGWAYEVWCCSDKDCEVAKYTDVKATDDGWQIVATGEVLPYVGDNRVRKSGDEFFHRCAHTAEPEKTICLYVPQNWAKAKPSDFDPRSAQVD